MSHIAKQPETVENAQRTSLLRPDDLHFDRDGDETAIIMQSLLHRSGISFFTSDSSKSSDIRPKGRVLGTKLSSGATTQTRLSSTNHALGEASGVAVGGALGKGKVPQLQLQKL
eukprot:1260093-Prymnesium_polylepis.1